MIVTISTEHRAIRNAGTLALLDAGGPSAPARVLFYAGAQPADGGAPAGAALIEATLAYPAGVVQPDGGLLLSTGAEVLASADGVAVWARIVNGTGTRVLDCDVSHIEGDGALRIAMAGTDGTSTQVWAGGAVQIASGVMG